MKEQRPYDYCPFCGAYHPIGASCDSDQIEPDIEGLEEFVPEEYLTES